MIAPPPNRARMIPGAYERKAPLQGALSTVAAGPPRTTPTGGHAVYVLPAPTRPTTWIGRAAAALDNVAFAMGLVLILALVPWAVRALAAAAAGSADLFGR